MNQSWHLKVILSLPFPHSNLFGINCQLPLIVQGLNILHFAFILEMMDSSTFKRFSASVENILDNLEDMDFTAFGKCIINFFIQFWILRYCLNFFKRYLIFSLGTFIFPYFWKFTLSFSLLTAVTSNPQDKPIKRFLPLRQRSLVVIASCFLLRRQNWYSDIFLLAQLMLVKEGSNLCLQFMQCNCKLAVVSWVCLPW